MPWSAWAERIWRAIMIPRSDAIVEVVMKRATFVRSTGTPTLRAAVASPPTAKIQLPKRVRASTHAAISVIAIHQITRSGNAYVVNVEPRNRCADAKPEAVSTSGVETLPGARRGRPAFRPARLKKG